MPVKWVELCCLFWRFLREKEIPLFSLTHKCYWHFADTELLPSQSPQQNKLLTEPSDFKRFPKPQGWTVTVSHESLTHSSRVVSWLLQPLSITRGQSEAVPGCVCVWLLYWEIVCFDLHILATAVSHFHASCCLYPVQFQWDNTVVKQSRIWHTMLTKLYFKLSLCAISVWCLHVMNMVVFGQLWLFSAQTNVNVVPQ